MTKQIKIHNVADLVHAVKTATAESTSQGTGDALWFRGQSNAAWDLQAALWRSDPAGTHTTGDERNLTHRFRTRAASRRVTTPEYGHHANWLSLMQHYGLPTRLLDWSRSPLIAAFFAVQKYLSSVKGAPEDASVWALSPIELNKRFLEHALTPALESKMCRHLVIPAFRNLDSSEGLERALKKGPVCAAMATETDQRMFVQQGCFTVHSPSAPPLQNWNEIGDILWKFVIPKRRVGDFARELDILGFRQGDIFPDLENLAGELKQTYPANSFGPS